MHARLLLDTGCRADAIACLRDALAICRDAGMQFCRPKVLSALSRAVEFKAERDRLLGEGEDLPVVGPGRTHSGCSPCCWHDSTRPILGGLSHEYVRI